MKKLAKLTVVLAFRFTHRLMVKFSRLKDGSWEMLMKESECVGCPTLEEALKNIDALPNFLLVKLYIGQLSPALQVPLLCLLPALSLLTSTLKSLTKLLFSLLSLLKCIKRTNPEVLMKPSS